MNVFDKKINPIGKILPYEEFRMFADLGELKVNERRAEAVIKEAEKYLAQDIPMLPASLYRDFFITGNRSNYQGPYFRRRRMIAYLSLAQVCEGGDRFAEKLMDTVWAVMEESTWIIPAHLYVSPMMGDATLGPAYRPEVLHGIDLFAAATGATLALAYKFNKESLDALSPVICEKIKSLVHERIILPFLQCAFWWTGETGRRVNNWCPWIISNILFCTAVIEEDLYIRERVVAKAITSLERFIGEYPPDGGCDEGPSYWNAAGAALFDCLELLEDMSGGKINVYHEEIIRNIGEYICKMNIDKDNIVNFADCGPRVCPDSSMIYRFGKKLGSDNLVSFAGRMAAINDMSFDQNLVYRAAKAMFSESVEPGESVAATSVYFPYLKVMTARECPDTSKGLFLAAKGGHNDEMHNHNDVGNFIVYYCGKPVIIDTGVGEYTRQTFSPRRYELWFMQSGYHNLPSFGGVDQRNGRRFKSESETFCEADKSFRAELCAAYPEEAGVISFVREVSLKDGRVTANDSYELTEEKTVEMHLMTAAEPIMLGGNKIKLPEDRVLTYDEKYTAEIEEIDPVGMNTKHMWKSDKLWRICLRARVRSGEFTLIVG